MWLWLNHDRGSDFTGKLTDKVVGLLEVLLDVLMWRIAGRYLHVLEALQMALIGTLAGNVQHTVGAHAAGIVGVAAIAQQ